MKKFYLLLSLSFILFSCGNDDSVQMVQNINSLNKVLLLKVDLDTYAFEGGRELAFAEANDFTIETEIDPLYVDGTDDTPLMGSSIITYSELNEVIFDADIFEDSVAQINFPQSFDSPEVYATITEEVEMPVLSMFEQVSLDIYLIAPDNVETHYPLIWNSIKKPGTG
jgi:hypothetical protein